MWVRECERGSASNSQKITPKKWAKLQSKSSFLSGTTECENAYNTENTRMSQQQYPVEVQPDFLEKITRAKPVQALAELIWNGLDADASQVAVSFDYNDIETLSEITIRDNGGGIPRIDAPEFFCRLGGSWKNGLHPLL